MSPVCVLCGSIVPFAELPVEPWLPVCDGCARANQTQPLLAVNNGKATSAKNREGDEILLPGFLGFRTVVELEEYDDETFVVVYADTVMNCWENRAGDKARWARVTGQFEKGLKTMRRGDRYPVRRTCRGQGV